jgi:hypothetical protein
LTRRHLQIALGILWLLDGVLQMQSFMYTRGLAEQIIAPAGQGQPGFVAAPLHLASTVIAAHPVAWNALFAGIQLLIGAGLLVPRMARLALAVSIAWALGVWYVSEGLGGIASGQASLLTGAPGSALLYAGLGAAAWPHDDASRERPAAWLPVAWAAVWIGGTGLQLLPAQNSGTAIASELTAGAAGAPAWLARLAESAGGWAAGGGTAFVLGLAVVQVLIGAGALIRATRLPAVVLGVALTLDFWVLGQHVGALYSGQATDPNSGPLLGLMGIAVLSLGWSPAVKTDRESRSAPSDSLSVPALARPIVAP